MKRRTIILVLCGLLCPWVMPSTTVAAIEGEEEPLVRLYKQLAPATVFLSVTYETSHPMTTPSNIGVGAGFVVDKSGLLLTNAHVVDGANAITATLFDGEKVPVELVAMDATEDIAVLQLPPGRRTYRTVTLGDSDSLHVGQQTLVVGSPFGLGFTLTTGIVSGLSPSAGARGSAATRVIQTTAPINPGNSGGPLVDSKGQVIGMTTATLIGAQNIGFAVPINIARKVLAEFKTHGTITRPWLGITGKFPTDPMLRLFAMPLAGGLLIEDVEDGSPAAEAGLKSGSLNVAVEGISWVLGGDILLALNGHPTRDPDSFAEAVKDLSPGQIVRMTVLRNGERVVMSALLKDRPRGHLRQRPPVNPVAGGSPSRGVPWIHNTPSASF